MIQIPQWLRDVDPSTLVGKHKQLVDMMGMEGMLNFIEQYSGTYYYVPKLDDLIRMARNQSILQDYMKGIDPKHLAHKYDLSVVQIYAIINQDKHEADKNQLSFFGEESAV